MNFQPALDAFRTALETLPERRDSKHPEKGPTFEPHYKLVSVVHKLVSSRRLPVSRYFEREPQFIPAKLATRLTKDAKS